MDRYRRLEVVDKGGKLQCYLSQNDGIIDCRIHTELNGTSTLTFSSFADHEKMAMILDINNRIVADGREYSILKNDAASFTRSQANVKSCEISAWETQFLLTFQYRTITNDPMHINPMGNDVIILSGKHITSQFWVDGKMVQNPHPIGSAAYCLYSLLFGSGWAMIGCDIDASIKYDLETRSLNIWENIQQAIKFWGGVLEWNSVAKTVFWHDEDMWQIFDGFQIKYRKNMRSLSKVQSNKFYTKLFVFGENHLSLKSINGGKEYLEDYSFCNDVLCGSITNSDIYVQESLLQWGKQQHKKLCRPSLLYRGSAIDLSKVSNFWDAAPVVGHMADIIDEDIVQGAKIQKRIVSYEYDFFSQWNCDIEIGDLTGNFTKKYVDLLFVAKKSDSTVNSGGNINGGNIRPGTYPELNDLDDRVQKGDNEIHLLVRDETGKLYSKIDVTSREIRTEVADTNKALRTTISQTASEIRREAIDTKNGLTSLVSQTAGQIRIEMNNSMRGMQTDISITAQGLRADMRDLDRGLSSQISASASNLRSEFRDADKGFSSKIEQNARSISMQANQINLKADKTSISGILSITNGLSNGSTTINGACIKTGTILANRIQTGVFLAANGTFRGTVQTSGLISGGRISGNSGDFNTLSLGGSRLGKQNVSINGKTMRLVTW